MTQINFCIEEDVKTNADPFYSAENITELERRAESLKNGTAKLKEHDLIEVPD